jgi:hydrophobic/amphiphilic exporter-1 (mainly G- bacteria), HAE1 family
VILQAIRRPIAVCMLTLIVVVFGIASLTRLPMTLMPEMASNNVTVITSLNGVSAEVVEERVTRPLENAFKEVSGLVEMTSKSLPGRSRISLRFSLSSDVEKSQQEVTELVSQSMRFLPRDINTPRVRRFNPNAEPMMVIGISSNMDSILLSNMIEDHLRTPIERIEGVAGVELYGVSRMQIQIVLQREKLQALGLSGSSIVSAISKANSVVQGGKIENAGKIINISIPSKIEDLSDLENLIVSQMNGINVKLKDVASVDYLRKKPDWNTYINGERGLRLAIMKNSDSNTVNLANELKKIVDKAQLYLPQAKLHILSDSSTYIKSALSNVSSSIFYGGILAILVLLLFLRTWQSTLVIAISIPVSIITTFIPLYIGGYTINVMTLGGLALGIGMLVDNAIVVLENIIVHRDKGDDMTTSAHKGSSKVFFALLASTTTTLIVFLPLLLMKGILGLFFNELAVVVGSAIIASLVSAIFIVPTLSKRLIPSKTNEHGILYTTLEKAFIWIEQTYCTFLKACIGNKISFTIILLLALASSLILIPHIPKSLMPKSDPGKISIRIDCPKHYEFDQLEAIVIDFSKKIQDVSPETMSIISFFGELNPQKRIMSYLALKPASERKRSTSEIIDALKQHFSNEVGLKLRIFPGRDPLTPKATAAKPKVYMNILGWNIIKAEEYGKKISEYLTEIDGISDAELKVAGSQTEKNFVIDRHRSEALGLSVSEISRSLKSLLAGENAGSFQTEGNEIPMRLMYGSKRLLTIEEVLNQSISNRKGDLIAYKSVMKIGERQSVTAIERVNGMRVTEIEIETEERTAEDIVKDIDLLLTKFPLPAGLSVEVGGSYIEDRKSTNEMIMMVLMAILLVYMVMAAQFESFFAPLKVLLSIPLAIIGVLWALFITNSSLNLQSYMGMVLLAGIVVNNAILLITTMQELKNNGMNQYDAAIESGRMRLRPILMTAMTTILGLLPLALGLGEGAEAQAPLARVVIGGLLSSTLITTLVIPIYSVINKGSTNEQAGS